MPTDHAATVASLRARVDRLLRNQPQWLAGQGNHWSRSKGKKDKKL